MAMLEGVIIMLSHVTAEQRVGPLDSCLETGCDDISTALICVDCITLPIHKARLP